MNPSLYQQVRENLADLDYILDVLRAPGGASIGNEGLVVKGIHINTDAVSTNKAPSAYTYGVTYEIKQVSTMGLSSKEGCQANAYVFVVTVKPDARLTGEANVNIPPFQIAVAPDNGGMYMYRRNYVNNAWTEWYSGGGSEEEPEELDLSRYCIDKSTQPTPTEQLPGDYWEKPISSCTDA